MLCKLIFINPATSAVSDRFFSTSRRLKLWLRSRMNQERFSNLIVLNIQKKDLTGLSTIDIANEFIGSITSRCSGKELVILGEGRPDTKERRKSSLTNLPSATQIESVILSLFNDMMYSNFNFIFFTILDLHNSSYHTQPHPIIANYAALSSWQLKQIVGFLAHL